MVTSFFLALLLLPLTGPAQESAEEMIEWTAGRPLTWSDYKGEPNPDSDAAATTTTLVGIEYHISNNQFSYSIQCRFSKNRSWGIHKTSYILSHEQGHFDIAEIFARKLHKEMMAYKFNKKTFEKDLKNIYNRVMTEKENFQNQYDRETRHSIHKENQYAWLARIEELLAETEAYADYK